jgi:hypothetical protein
LIISAAVPTSGIFLKACSSRDAEEIDLVILAYFASMRTITHHALFRQLMNKGGMNLLAGDCWSAELK